MITLSGRHPFVACAEFAMEFLEALARYDLARLGLLIDRNSTGLALKKLLPKPEGFSYCDPLRVENWSMHITGVEDGGLACDFELPFDEDEYRPMVARFSIFIESGQMSIELTGVVPS